MEYVEKVIWKRGGKSAHSRTDLDWALKNMAENEKLHIISSELFDENGKMIATYKKGEGVKMVKEIEEIEKIVVSKETFDFITNDKRNYYQMFSDWKAFGNSPLDKAMTELNRLYKDKYVSDIFDMLTKGKAKLVSKGKQYRIILEGLHRFEGVQTYSEYVYLKPDGTLAKTKSFDYIAKLSEKQVKELPEWVQPLAEEVK